MNTDLTYRSELYYCRYLQRLQALSGESTSCFDELRGFQPVSPSLDVGSPYLRYGLLDEVSSGWKHGFGFFVG